MPLASLVLVAAAAGDAPVPAGYGAMLVRVVLALLGVCALAYLVLRFLGQRAAGAGTGAGLMRIVGRLHLEPRRALYVVEVAGRYLLVGSGDGGAPALLCELDAEAVRRLTATPPHRASFREILTGGRGAAAPPVVIRGEPEPPPRDRAAGDGRP